MSQRTHKKQHEFFIELKDKHANAQTVSPEIRLQYVMDACNNRLKNPVDHMLWMEPTDNAPSEISTVVFISLSEQLEGVDKDYFSKKACRGYKTFADHDFEVIRSSHHNVRDKFASLKHGNKWALPNTDVQLPAWIKIKEQDAAKEVNLGDITKFKDKKQMIENYILKLQNGGVRDPQEFFSQCQTIDMKRIVSENLEQLTKVTKLVKVPLKKLPPLPDMLTTLKVYCNDRDLETLNVAQVKQLIGDHTTKYYEICQAMTRVYLLQSLKRKNAVILHGVTSSGKSTIAEYMQGIFISHLLGQNPGSFHDEIDAEGAHKQLLVIDEANMYSLFAKQRISDTKLLLEGKGMQIVVKYHNPFKGFKGCKTLITCNNLPYPFTIPASSLGGFTAEEMKQDCDAVNARVVKVCMDKSYHTSDSDFPFTEQQWAQCLLSMAVDHESYDDYKNLAPVFDAAKQKKDRPVNLEEALAQLEARDAEIERLKFIETQTRKVQAPIQLAKRTSPSILEFDLFTYTKKPKYSSQE